MGCHTKTGKCYICGYDKFEVLKATPRDKKKLKILKCYKCGLVFLEKFAHISDDFYADDGMEKNNADASVPDSMDYLDSVKRVKLHYKNLLNKKILDFGCGNGSFLKRLKAEAVSEQLFALEPNKKFHEPLSKDFTLFKTLAEVPDKSIDVITMFHVLEHLKDPRGLLNALYEKISKNGIIIIEVPSSTDVLANLYSCDSYKKFTYWSCHLFLFNVETLSRLLAGTKYKVDAVRQYQRYTLANHLHWLSRGKPGGHVSWSFLDDDMLQACYEKKLAEAGQTDSVLAVISKKK